MGSMPNSFKARPTSVRSRASTGPPAFGVRKKWLARSLYRHENHPFVSHDVSDGGHDRAGGFLIDQLRVVDFAGRIVQDHDQVQLPFILKPTVLAAVNVQQHAWNRSARPPAPMWTAFAPDRNQPRSLKRILHPRIAVMDSMLLPQLLVKMTHIKIRILLPIQFQDLLQFLHGHLLRTWPFPSVVVQT